MALLECNCPTTEFFFSESPVVSHRSCKNIKENIQRSDSENSCQEQRWKTTYLLKYKESYIVATSEIDAAHGLKIYIAILTNELQEVVHDVRKRIIHHLVQEKFAQRYAIRVIQHVYLEEQEAQEQKRKTRTGMIKFGPKTQEGKEK